MEDTMKIIPLASDSMGTRSMATFVKTRDCGILIDPGVALGPIRYGLAPHPKEEAKLGVHQRRIRSYAKRSDILVITHYHYDHHDPAEPGLYEDKILLARNPKKNINKSQKKRSRILLEELGDIPNEVRYSDGEEWAFGKTTIRFSNAVPHGSNTKLGFVTEVSITEGRSKFLYTSDVQGPCLDDQTQFIIDEDPNVIFCDGPMTYMMGFRFSKKSYEDGLENIKRIIDETRVKRFALDHHLLRDLKWKEKIQDIFDCARKKRVKIITLAEFAGMKNIVLEARRKELWGKKAKKISK
jgi:predicted metallo-beta-lactamase superfamily hydrolase